MISCFFIRVIRFILALCACIGCSSALAEETTLCKAHEEVYFSCHIAKKIASVCASGNISPENGYVQYRFGDLSHVELEYPNLPYAPRNSFSISDIDQGNAKFTHLKFKSGKYNYVIYSGFPSGLYIKKSGKTISNLTCDPGDYQAISPRAFRGIRTVPPANDIDN